MKYKYHAETGEWEGGREPSAKEIGAPAFIGFEYMDFKREYRAHIDKYPDAASNVRFCQEVTGVAAGDLNKPTTRRGKMAQGGYK